MQTQAEGAQQINAAMEQLREAVQQTATSLQESTRAIAQLNLAAQGLHATRSPASTGRPESF